MFLFSFENGRYFFKCEWEPQLNSLCVIEGDYVGIVKKMFMGYELSRII